MQNYRLVYELEIEADDEDEARAAADATVESELGTECQLDWEITEVA